MRNFTIKLIPDEQETSSQTSLELDYFLLKMKLRFLRKVNIKKNIVYWQKQNTILYFCFNIIHIKSQAFKISLFICSSKKQKTKCQTISINSEYKFPLGSLSKKTEYIHLKVDVASINISYILVFLSKV